MHFRPLLTKWIQKRIENVGLTPRIWVRLTPGDAPEPPDGECHGNDGPATSTDGCTGDLFKITLKYFL